MIAKDFTFKGGVSKLFLMYMKVRGNLHNLISIWILDPLCKTAVICFLVSSCTMQF